MKSSGYQPSAAELCLESMRATRWLPVVGTLVLAPACVGDRSTAPTGALRPEPGVAVEEARFSAGDAQVLALS